MREFAAAVMMVGVFGLIQQGGEKPPAQPDPLVQAQNQIKSLMSQVSSLTGQRDRCWTELGEKTMAIADVERNANAGLIGDVRQARSAALSDLAKKVEAANKGRYKIDITTGEITLVEKGK